MNNNYYRKGYRVERKVIERLYAQGACLVLSSRGSRGIIDVVGFFPDKAVLVQVKAGKHPRLQLDERREIRKLVKQLKSDAFTVEVWLWKDRSTEPKIYTVKASSFDGPNELFGEFDMD